MINNDDVYFHTPTSDHYSWAETNYFGFYIPEENIMVGVYVQARANIGSVLSSINITNGVSNTPHEVLYSDCHVFLPMPKGNLDDFELENGLAITCTKPVMDYHIRFNDPEQGVSFDVQYKGLMKPYDIHDPEMDPLANQTHENDVISAAAYAGHWDQSGHVTGTLNIDGKTYQVNCTASMDHSWGLRDEKNLKNFCWMNANFENDTSIHCLFLVDPKRLDAYPAIVHGYVREGEQVYGLKRGTGKVKRDGYLHKLLELEVEDIRGKSHQFTGTPATSNPWLAWPLMFLVQSLCNWEMDGVKGWGEVQDLCKETVNDKLRA